MSRFWLATPSAIDPENLREALLLLLLRVSAVLGFLVCVPSAYVAFTHGFVRVSVMDAMALLGVLALLRFALLSSFSLFVTGALNRAAPEMTIQGANGCAEWAIITINFALVNTLITLAVGTVVAAVSDALKREVTSRISLDQERLLLRTLIDTLPDAVFTKDLSGRFVNCNAAHLALLGLEREEQAIGKTVFDIHPPTIAAEYHANDLAVIGGGELRDQLVRGLDRAGNETWALTTKVLLRDSV